MALKNVVRKKTGRFGQTTWELETLGGEPVEAFTVFCEKMLAYPFATRKRYAEVVSRFIDYLYEAGVFSAEGVPPRRINAIIDAFPLLVRDGSTITSRRVLERLEGGSQDAWLVDVAQALQWPPLLRGSLANLFPAVNKFLALSESLSLEEFEHSRLLGIEHHDNHRQLIKALEGSTIMPAREVAKMRQNSLLGGVAKFAPKGIKRPRRLAAQGGTKQSDQQKLDFPLEYLNALIAAATSWRDKALWLLLAASGIRTSEARNLLLDDVDCVEQQVYVIDPAGRRFAPTQSLAERPRFKGRAIALTYLFPPLRSQFFEALQKYMECEYTPVQAAGEPRYLFQYIEPKRRGKPLVYASDTALGKNFKRAAAKANVPLPISGQSWVLHSLRHLYGVHMLNDYPVDAGRGIFGLQLVEVQMLMGHASINTTRHYARSKPHRLMAKLQASDEAMLSLPPEEARLLPRLITQRLEMRA